MEFLEWNVICRVCLQEGEMRSIYEKDDKNITICEKIIKCSNITIKRGMNFPEQICNKCFDDLHVAYKFRTNCESSDAILQSFMEGQAITDLIMSSESGEVYKYKPPQGLNVKRIRPVPVKYELPPEDDRNLDQNEQANSQVHVQNAIAVQISDDNVIEEQVVIEEDHFASDDAADNLDNGIKEEEESHALSMAVQVWFGMEITQSASAKFTITLQQQSPEQQGEAGHESKFSADVFIRSQNEVVSSSSRKLTSLLPTILKSIFIEQQTENRFEISENGKVCTIKPVKTNKARSKATAAKEKLRVVSATEISTKPDGTTVIRVRRNVEEPKPLKICEICGNTYKYKHALESHMRRHRNEKPFSCEICNRSFVINFELRRHMRTHTGQKPYACRYCGRRFSDFGSRIKHERTHTGERPYTCETCGKSFAYSHVLSSHILTHTGEKRFGCVQCGKRFAKSHHLKAHMNTHMKNKPVLIKTNATTAVGEESADKSVLYQTDEKVYQEVINVLTAQPKIESYVDEEDIKVMYTNAETQHAINTINMNS